MNASRDRARWLHLALFVLSVAPLLHLLLAGIGALPAALSACPYLSLTGDPCPLCGTSRAALALLSGDLSASLDQTPLAAGLIVAAVTQPPYRLLRTLRPRWSWREELAIDGPGLAWLAAVLLVSGAR